MSDSCNLVDCSPPSFLSMGFPRQEPWSELLFSSPVDHSDPGIEFTSPALKLDYLLLGHQGSHIHMCMCVCIFTLQVITRYCAMCCVLRHSVMSDSLQPFWNVVRQAPVSMGFSRQDYWSGLPCPPPGDLPNPGIGPWSPTLQADSLPSELPGKPVRHWDTEYCSLGYTLGPCSSILFIVLWYL